MEWKSRRKLLDEIEHLKVKIKDQEDEIAQYRAYQKDADETLKRLKDIERINMVIIEKNLAKCESAVCISCIHSETETDCDGRKQIIGCRKTIACSDYEPIKAPAPENLTVINNPPSPPGCYPYASQYSHAVNRLW